MTEADDDFFVLFACELGQIWAETSPNANQSDPVIGTLALIKSNLHYLVSACDSVRTVYLLLLFSLAACSNKSSRAVISKEKIVEESEISFVLVV